MKRSVVFGVLTCVLVTAMAVRMQGQQGPGGKGNGAADGPEGDSRIQIGFRIAPVPLNLEGKNPALVGLGSYIVNAHRRLRGMPQQPAGTHPEATLTSVSRSSPIPRVTCAAGFRCSARSYRATSRRMRPGGPGVSPSISSSRCSASARISTTPRR